MSSGAEPGVIGPAWLRSAFGKVMKRNLQIKPSKPMSVLGMIVGSIAALIGVFVLIPSLSRDHGPVWFGMLWTGVAVAGVLTGAINAFSDKGIPTEVIVSESSGEGTTRSTEDRLRELDDLLGKQMISQDEYARTRNRILEEH